MLPRKHKDAGPEGTPRRKEIFTLKDEGQGKGPYPLSNLCDRREKRPATAYSSADSSCEVFI